MESFIDADFNVRNKNMTISQFFFYSASINLNNPAILRIRTLVISKMWAKIQLHSQDEPLRAVVAATAYTHGLRVGFPHNAYFCWVWELVFTFIVSDFHSTKENLNLKLRCLVILPLAVMALNVQ